ncbi:MAG: hypothetical protein OHK0037_14800 [Elainellaceae cyanobacterium]
MDKTPDGEALGGKDKQSLDPLQSGYFQKNLHFPQDFLHSLFRQSGHYSAFYLSLMCPQIRFIVPLRLLHYSNSISSDA